MNRYSTVQDRAFKAAVSANVPVFLQGEPGIGKSAYIRDYAEATGREFYVARGVSQDRVEVAGLMVHDEQFEAVDYIPQKWAKKLAQAERGLLLLGEFNLSPDDVQKAYMSVIQERAVGDFTLPPSVSIVLDGNDLDSSAGATYLPAPVANRMMHLGWELDAEAWKAGMLDGFSSSRERFSDVVAPTPERVAMEKSMAVTFIDQFEHLLHRRPSTPMAQSGAWPSPRSWDNVTRVLTHLDEDDTDARFAVVQGLVGEECAVKYLSWRTDVAGFSIPDLIRDPSTENWASTPPTRALAVVSAISAYALSKKTPETWVAAVEAVTHIAKTSRKKDIALHGMESLLARPPKGVTVPTVAVETFRPLMESAHLWKEAQK